MTYQTVLKMAVENDRQAIEVLLNQRFFFVVVISKSKSIGELSAEIQNVACELYAEFRGEVSVLETKNGARIPHRYTVGDVLSTKSAIVAYSSDYEVSTGKKKMLFNQREICEVARKIRNTMSTSNEHCSLLNTTCSCVDRFINRPVPSDKDGTGENCLKTTTKSSLHENTADCEEQSHSSQGENKKVEETNNTEMDQIRRKLSFSECSRIQSNNGDTTQLKSRVGTITVSEKGECQETGVIEYEALGDVTDKCEAVETRDDPASNSVEAILSTSKYRNLFSMAEHCRLKRKQAIEASVSKVADWLFASEVSPNTNEHISNANTDGSHTETEDEASPKQASKWRDVKDRNSANDDASNCVISDGDTDKRESSSKIKQVATVYSPKRYLNQTKENAVKDTKGKSCDKKNETTQKSNTGLKGGIDRLVEQRGRDITNSKQKGKEIQLSRRRLSTISSGGSVTSPCSVIIKKLPVSRENGNLTQINCDDLGSSSDSESDLDLALRLKKLRSRAVNKTPVSKKVESTCQVETRVMHRSTEERGFRSSQRTSNNPSLSNNNQGITCEVTGRNFQIAEGGETRNTKDAEILTSEIRCKRQDASISDAKMEKDRRIMEKRQHEQPFQCHTDKPVEETKASNEITAHDVDKGVECSSSEGSHWNSNCGVIRKGLESRSPVSNRSSSSSAQRRREIEEKLNSEEETQTGRKVLSENMVGKKAHGKKLHQSCEKENAPLSKEDLSPSKGSFPVVVCSKRGHSSICVSTDSDVVDKEQMLQMREVTPTENAESNTRMPDSDVQSKEQWSRNEHCSSPECESSRKGTEDESSTFDSGSLDKSQGSKDCNKNSNLAKNIEESAISSVNVTTDEVDSLKENYDDLDTAKSSLRNQVRTSENDNDVFNERSCTEKMATSAASRKDLKSKDDGKRRQIDSMCSKCTTTELVQKDQCNSTKQLSSKENCEETKMEKNAKYLQSGSNVNQNLSGVNYVAPDLEKQEELDKNVDKISPFHFRENGRLESHVESNSSRKRKRISSFRETNDTKFKKRKDDFSSVMGFHRNENDAHASQEENVSFSVKSKQRQLAEMKRKDESQSNNQSGESDNEDPKPIKGKSSDKESDGFELCNKGKDVSSSINEPVANGIGSSSDEESDSSVKDVHCSLIETKQVQVDEMKHEYQSYSQSQKKSDNEEEESLSESDDDSFHGRDEENLGNKVACSSLLHLTPFKEGRNIVWMTEKLRKRKLGGLDHDAKAVEQICEHRETAPASYQTPLRMAMSKRMNGADYIEPADGGYTSAAKKKKAAKKNTNDISTSKKDLVKLSALCNSKQKASKALLSLVDFGQVAEHKNGKVLTSPKKAIHERLKRFRQTPKGFCHTVKDRKLTASTSCIHIRRKPRRRQNHAPKNLTAVEKDLVTNSVNIEQVLDDDSFWDT
ncbi:uncharacterized protein [Montipora capricornis]|uniref:uncharacterized protein isoform X3 n=2 Tax=Montipora capricornis TaxID=246305 RepID=UPI0035F1AE2A